MRRIAAWVAMAAVLASAGPAAAAGRAGAAPEDPRASVVETVAVEPATGATSPRVVELQRLHGAAQQHIEAYNASRNVADLDEARVLLTRWLVGHREVYGDTPEAVAVRGPIEQQLGSIDAELLRVGAHAPPPTPVVEPEPAPRPMSREQLVALQRARKLTGAGTTLIVMGSLTVLGAGLPLWLLRDRALRRANEQRFYVDEQRLVMRARRRQAIALSMTVVGSGLAAAGLGLVVVGGVRRSQARRELTLAPELGWGLAGASATLRF